jgi:DNA-binding MarR family transcriptional regulator
MSKLETAPPTAPPRSSADETWRLLLDVCLGLVREHLSRTVAVFDLSLTQAHALRCIAPDRPLPMGELAEQLKCDPSNVTGVVDRLEARGLVVRRSATRDRRVKTLLLTPAGAALRERLEAWLSHPPPALAALGVAEQEQLGALLARVLAEVAPPHDA